MAIARQQRLSLDTFLQLPEQKPALEYLDGVVTQKMAPKGPHGRLQGKLFMVFELFLEPRRLGWVFSELRTTYTEANASLVPDLSVYLADRTPAKPSGEVADDFFDPPDIAIEIMSPGQMNGQLARRARWFLEHGVRIVLVLDSRRRAARVFRPGSELGPLHGPERVDLGDVLPGFSFVVEELFTAIDVR